jgi:sugar phosphate isomerase/epimerase
MELLGSRVTGFHAKDAIPAKFGEFGGKQTPVGEGRVDFERLFRQLKELGYTGDVVIEHEMYSRPDRDGDMLKAREYLEKLIKEL